MLPRGFFPPRLFCFFLPALLFVLMVFFLKPVWAGPAATLACPDRVELGKPFAVRLTSAAPVAAMRVSWLGRTVPVSISTWNGKSVGLALLGTDLLKAGQGNRTVKVTAVLGGEEVRFSRSVRVLGRKKSAARSVQKLTVKKKMATPPESVLNRIAADRKEVGRALKRVSTSRSWRLPFARPVPGIITSPYGIGRIFNGKRRNPHRGLDFRAAQGAPVRAACDGRVTLVGDHYFAGRSVYIDHGLGVTSLYFHLSRTDVREGQTVRRGQVIGRAGSTGRVTGPHLHFSVSVLGHLVDPLPLLKKGTDGLLAGR